MATVYVSGNPPFTTPPPEPWQAGVCYDLGGPSRDNWSPLCINERINGEYENIADFWYDASPVNAFTRDYDPYYSDEVLRVHNRIQIYSSIDNALESNNDKDKLTANTGSAPLYQALDNQTDSSISAWQFNNKYFEYSPTIAKPQFSLVVELDALPNGAINQTIFQSLDSSTTSHHLYYEYDPSGVKALKYDVSDGTNSANCTINIDLSNNRLLIILIDYNTTHNEMYLSLNVGDGNIYTDTTIAFNDFVPCNGLAIGANDGLTQPLKGKIAEIYNFGSTLVE